MDQLILIVENNLVDKSSIELILKKVGCSVEFAGDTEEALKRLIISRPFLILISLTMPGLDSYTFTRILKNDADTRDIMIVALLQSDIEIECERMIACGFDDFLKIKPTEDSFVNKVLNFLERTKK